MVRKAIPFLLVVFLASAEGCRQRGLSHLPRVRSAEETSRDYDIFDTVLPDLIDNKDFNPAVGGRAAERRQVILDDATYGGASAKLVERVPLGLTRDVRSRLLDDTVRRNPPDARSSIATYHPANRNVLVYALSNADLDIGFADRFPSARVRSALAPWLYRRRANSAVRFLLRAEPPRCHRALPSQTRRRELES